MAWESRFASNEIKWAAPEDLLANPANARRHPGDQREAIIESLDAVGWVAPLIVNVTTNRLLDGHARTEEAITAGAPLVPFVEIAVSEDEERRILATLDPIGALATYDAEIGRDLMAGFVGDDTATAMMLTAILDRFPTVKVDPAVEWDRGGLPDFDANDLGSAMHVTVHFRSADDKDRFFELVGGSGSNRSMWWPESDGHVGSTVESEWAAVADE